MSRDGVTTASAACVPRATGKYYGRPRKRTPVQPQHRDRACTQKETNPRHHMKKKKKKKSCAPGEAHALWPALRHAQPGARGLELRDSFAGPWPSAPEGGRSAQGTGVWAGQGRPVRQVSSPRAGAASSPTPWARRRRPLLRHQPWPSSSARRGLRRRRHRSTPRGGPPGASPAAGWPYPSAAAGRRLPADLHDDRTRRPSRSQTLGPAERPPDNARGLFRHWADLDRRGRRNACIHPGGVARTARSCMPLVMQA